MITSPQNRSTARRALLCVAAAAALLAAAPPARAQSGAGEYEVKAAFLYNFARFGEWPGAAFTEAGRLRLCVLGADPFGGSLAAVAGKPVGTRNLDVARIDSVDDARRCQILFISGTNLAAAVQVMRRIERLPVLTVAEMPDFARSGGAIEFNLVDNRVRFSINPAAAQRAGITLSSQLLRLATIVEERQ